MTEGLLQEISLDGVIQLMTLGGGTGELELVPLLPPHQAHSRVPVGHLYFREGMLHAAFLADRGGEAVMKTLFLWEAGFFSWTPRDWQAIPPANIMMDTTLAILGGIKHHQSWTQAREVIPTLRLVLYPQASSHAPPESHTLEAQMLALCDGQTQLGRDQRATGRWPHRVSLRGGAAGGGGPAGGEGTDDGRKAGPQHRRHRASDAGGGGRDLLRCRAATHGHRPGHAGPGRRSCGSARWRRW